MMDVPGAQAFPRNIVHEDVISLRTQLNLSLYLLRRVIRDLHIAQRHEGLADDCSQGYCAEARELQRDGQ